MIKITTKKGLELKVALVNKFVTRYNESINCKTIAVIGNWYTDAVLRPLDDGHVKGDVFYNYSGDNWPEDKASVEMREDILMCYRDPREGEEYLKITVFARDHSKVDLDRGMPYVTIKYVDGEWYVNGEKPVKIEVVPDSV